MRWKRIIQNVGFLGVFFWFWFFFICRYGCGVLRILGSGDSRGSLGTATFVQRSRLVCIVDFWDKGVSMWWRRIRRICIHVCKMDPPGYMSVTGLWSNSIHEFDRVRKLLMPKYSHKAYSEIR